MLELDELADVASTFGVTEEQVRRDHLISHVLVALESLGLPLVFFGGTALARTFVADPDAGARMSEDIDLYSAERKDAAATMDEMIPRLLRREFPRTQWDPALSAVRSVDPAHLVTSDGVRLRMQLLDSRGDHHEYRRWPVEAANVQLRYRDVPPTLLMSVPTLPAFAAMKTAAWVDRRAARDLYDLAALARIGAITEEAAALQRSVVGWAASSNQFSAATVVGWETQLAHQTRVLPSAEECLREVRQAYAAALGWSPHDPDA
jgi:predicted nucleotidyltransferase component of viral defense system